MMDQTIIPVAIALISTVGAFVSVVFSRRSARGERLEAADQVAIKFREPLLHAAFNLQTRVYNILELNFFDRFLGEWNSPEEREYAVTHTLYVIAQYFCWVEVLRRDSQFIDPRNDERNRSVARALEAVRETFCDSIALSDPIFRIFRGQQRALGEVMLVPVPDPPPGVPRWECLGYAAFVEGLDDSRMARWFSQLREDIDTASRDLARHDTRLRLVQRELMNLIDVMDPDARRVPPNMRNRVAAPVVRVPKVRVEDQEITGRSARGNRGR
jgi:hypothetical protein